MQAAGQGSDSTAETLGDCEAATLALAYGHGFIAVINEKKATKISAERFRMLKLGKNATDSAMIIDATDLV